MVRCSTAILLLVCWLGPVGPACAKDSNPLGLVSGPNTGTQIRFGRDIAGIANRVGLDVEVKESQGSLDNIKRMASKENAALGIVYADALYYLSNSKDPEMRRLASRLRLIFPLYPAEAHLLARRPIQALSDLQGKTVVAGEAGSGTWLTTLNLLQLTDVKPAKLLNMQPDAALIALLKGEVDAMFFVVGKPVSLFSRIGNLIENPKFATLVSNVNFVPLIDARLLKTYNAAKITPSDYGWMKTDVQTVAVKAVLMTFDFSANQSPYFAQRCRQLATLSNVVRDSLEDLRKTGHPKWKDVNLDEPVSIWELDRCSHAKQESATAARSNIDKELRKSLGLQ
jgi:uncharacterized protein